MKFQSNSDIAGSPRNSFRASLKEEIHGGRALTVRGAFTGYQQLSNSEYRSIIPVSYTHLPYKKQIAKYVSAPANAKKMRVNLEKKLADMEAYANEIEINQPEWHSTKIGVVTSGISYQYAKETFGEDASYLNLGMTFPLPTDLIKDFCSKVDKVYVIEEMDPYLQEFLEGHGIKCIGNQQKMCIRDRG